MTTRRRRHGALITVHVGRGHRRRRRHRGGAAVGLWGALGALFTLIGVIFDTMTLLIMGITFVGIAGATAAVAAHDRRKARQGGQGGVTPTPAPANPRNGSAPGVQTRRSPVAGRRTRSCGRACQTSRQPRDTCDCSCSGANHGRMVGRPATQPPVRKVRAPGTTPVRKANPKAPKAQPRPPAKTGSTRPTRRTS